MESKSHKMGRAVPVFSVADIGMTIEWYQKHLGFWSDPFPPNPPYVFARMFRDDIEVMLQRIEGYEKPDIYGKRSGGVWDSYIRVEGVKELYEAVRNRVTIVQPLAPATLRKLGVRGQGSEWLCFGFQRTWCTYAFIDFTQLQMKLAI